MIDPKQIEHIFGFHKATTEPGPNGEEPTLPRHTAIRLAYREFTEKIEGYIPEGREKSIWLTTMQEAAMWANAAIAMDAPAIEERYE